MMAGGGWSVITELLGPTNYHTYLAGIGDGQDAYTHKALIAFHDGPAVQAYVKIYCAVAAPRGVVNEIVGYKLAAHRGIAVPHRSAVMRLLPRQCSFLPREATPITDHDGLVVAWCVEDLGGETPKQIYNLRKAAGTAIVEDIAKWSKVPDVIALDAWLLNEDRNLGNLVRLGKGRYAVIDHGRVCTGNAWSPPLDRKRKDHRNVLAEIVWSDPVVENAPIPSCRSLIDSLGSHTAVLAAAEFELAEWLDELEGADASKDVMGFLADRAADLVPHYKAAFGLLL